MEIDKPKHPDALGPVRQQLPRSPAEHAEAVLGAVDYATWLSDDLLLMVGWFHEEEGYPLKAYLLIGDERVTLNARCVSYPRPDLSETDPRLGKVKRAIIDGC